MRVRRYTAIAAARRGTVLGEALEPSLHRALRFEQPPREQQQALRCSIAVGVGGVVSLDLTTVATETALLREASRPLNRCYQLPVVLIALDVDISGSQVALPRRNSRCRGAASSKEPPRSVKK